MDDGCVKEGLFLKSDLMHDVQVFFSIARQYHPGIYLNLAAIAD